MIEAIGLFASILILVSMSFKSSNVKGNILMRVINIIGSVLFVYYGFQLTAYSTAVLNIGAIMINSYHLIMLIKNLKK